MVPRNSKKVATLDFRKALSLSLNRIFPKTPPFFGIGKFDLSKMVDPTPSSFSYFPSENW